MGERMLEGIFDLGEEARLIEELGGLQMREAQAERLLTKYRQWPGGAPRAHPCR